MDRILVTGGAGYIGSHIVRSLLDRGRDLTVLDDLSQGHAEAIGTARLVRGDFGDPALLDEVLRGGGYGHVIHMAAFCEVGESMREPGAYYRNNVKASLELLEAAHRHGIRGLVFSSTAATYGQPETVPITEEEPQHPTNPYGETKLAFERALAWYHRAHGMGYVALRYFNAAGAHPDGSIGEDHSPESHLLPRLLGSIGEDAEPIPIFGNDYPTSDGTCVRDYVHVCDLAQAHVLALEALDADPPTGRAYNLGNGEGFSVREVVETVERVTGRRPPTRDAPRRPGDPATLVASSERISRELGWKASFPGLEEIVRTAWNWHRERPRGFGSDHG